MGFQEQQLGQTQPAAATAGALYSPAASTTAIVKSIMIANTGALTTYRIYNDDNGTTRTTATAIAYDVQIPANTTVEFNTFIPLNNSLGEVAVESASGNVTFTAYGAEIT